MDEVKSECVNVNKDEINKMNERDISYNNINSINNNESLCESDLYLKTKHNKEMKIEEFFKQRKHFFIMTDGGTPIYSRYGDELQNSDILATFSAIIIKFTVFNANQNFAEKLNYISNDKCSIVFLKKRKIFFIALSKKQDSISFLNSQLELLWYQLLSIITSQRLIHLEEKPSSFISALQGTEELFEQMIEYTSKSLVSLISSYHVFPIENRSRLNQICSNYLGEALLCCLFTPDGSKMIAMSKSNLISIIQTDIILIQNLIMQNNNLLIKELWLPICLPGISEDGFVQLYSNFISHNKIGIIYITQYQEDSFYTKLSEQSRKVIECIEHKGLFKIIESALELDSEVNDNDININEGNEAELFIKQLLRENNASNKNNSLNNSIGENKTNTDSSCERTKSFSNSNNNIQEHNPVENNDSMFSSMIIHPHKMIMEIEQELPINKRISLSQNVYHFKGGKSDPLKRILYCVCKHKKYNQFFSVNFNIFSKITKQEKKVYKKYAKLYDFYCSHGSDLIDSNNFYHIEKDSNYTHIIYNCSENYLLMATMNLFISSSEILVICKEIFKLIKAHESNFFIYIK
jgi:hypothetical protein